NKEKQEQLKGIIKKLHAGSSVHDLKEEFADLLEDLSAEEIASMEQALVDEGFPVSSIQDLCEVHVEVFEDSLKKAKDQAQIDGHPVHTFRQENRELEKRLDALEDTLKSLKKKLKKKRIMDESRKGEILESLSDLQVFEKHYQRKENQLFPKLEATGFTGPTSVMWGKHDEIRDAWKQLRGAVEGDTPASEVWELFKTVKKKMEKMIFMEEKILYPTSLRKLTPVDWAAIRDEEEEIGYSWVNPGSMWDSALARKSYVQEQRQSGDATTPAGPNIHDYMGTPTTDKEEKGERGVKPIQIPLNEGFLTQEQLDLMLRNLPFDITYVDENDKVRYYSATEDRVFPRTPSIIGRDVQKCHPPKSVHIVEKIVEAFKNRERDQAEFWLDFRGRMIHIRYFPIFDEQDNYRGVIEVSQDITAIQKLSGERRLLDWT
ncbi:MAG TPA: DUF438 domain-containing protein, partial [Sediminispirochaeta sp.]|nr:DUF438 domain-containing protein [Sediminispirochaeta sp.]